MSICINPHKPIVKVEFKRILGDHHNGSERIMIYRSELKVVAPSRRPPNRIRLDG